MEERKQGATFALKVDDRLPVESANDSSNDSSNSSSDVNEPHIRKSVHDICIAGVDLGNHILIVCLTLFTLYHSLDAVGPFNLHAALCTLGYVLLMSEAIVVFTGDGILTNFLTHRAKRHVHWILQAFGLFCTAFGIFIMCRAKVSHFLSTHALLGIISLSIMLFLAAFGYPVFMAAKLRNVVRPVVIKFSHNFLGLSCFLIGMASQCYGYKKFRALNFSNIDVRVVCVCLTIAIAMLSARKAFPTLYRQFLLLFK